ncbi:MAG: efflux RND transporter periplasmic adaptor subunit [Anaerolineae bacterium]
MKKGTFILAIVLTALVASAGFWFYQQQNAPRAQAATLATATITRGTLTATVSGAGNLFAPQETSLSFQLTGTPITKINVQVGDKVKAGDVLAQVDDSDLQLALTIAQAQLTTAQANLAKLLQPPLAADVQADQAAVASAQAAYAAAVTKAGHSTDTIAAAQAVLSNAAAARQQAQAAYDRIGGASNPNIGMTSQSLALEQATNNYQSALSAYNLALADVNDSAVKAAAQQLAQAQDNLTKLTQPATAQDQAIAQASVDSAQASVKQAELKLNQARITAPFDGTVAAVNGVVGQLSSAGSSAVITLANLDNLQTQISLSEVDIARVKVNDPISLSFDALGGQALPGKIVSISPVGTVASGVVNYTVTVALTKNSANIMPGMTATANVVVDQRADVLMAPNRAIKTQGNRKTLTLLSGDSQTTVLVKTGVVGDQNTEIVSATTMDGQPITLNEGETLVVNPTTTTSSASNTRGVPGGNPLNALSGLSGR